MKALTAIVATVLLWGACTLDKSGTGDVTGRAGAGGSARGGTTGTAGVTGGGGAIGTAGATGDAGTSGAAGTSGIVGTTDVADTTGAAGHDGTGGGGSSGKGGSGATGGTGYISCVNPNPVVIGGEDTGYVRCMGGGAIVHRPHAMDCPNLLPRASGGACVAPGTTAQPCANDAACTARPHGYCAMVPTNHLPACGCLYGCVRDSDCFDGQICECGDPIGVCRAASCATDSACPAGSLCASADLAWGGCAFIPPPRGYECQTQADTCLTNIDCMNPLPVCAFSSAAGTRGCHEAQQLCP